MAVSSEKQAREYGNAIIQDAETIGRSLSRNMQLQHTTEAIARGISVQQLALQQQTERGALSREQMAAQQSVGMNQILVEGMLRGSQIAQTGVFRSNAYGAQANLAMQQDIIGDSYALQAANNANKFQLDQQVEGMILHNAHIAQSGQLQGTALSAQTGYNYEAQRLNLASGVSQANTSAMSGAIQGLLQLGGVGFDTYQNVQAYKAEEQANQYILEGIGWGDSNFGTPPTPQQQASYEAQQKVVAYESTQSAQAGAQLIAEGDPVSVNAGVQLIQGTTYQQLSGIRGHVYAARAMYPAALEEAVAAGVIRPGAEGYGDLIRFNQEYAKATGLTAAPRALVAKVVGPTVAAAMQNTLQRVTAENAEAVKLANQLEVKSRISEIADGSTPDTVADDIKEAADAVIHGGIGFHGKYSKAANVLTIGEFLNNLSTNGNIETIQALRDVEMVPGTKLTWGKAYDEVFDAAEKQAFESNIREYDTTSKLRSIAHDKAIRIYRDNPNEETLKVAKQALRKIGTEEALRELASLELRAGANYDPTIATNITKDIARGKLPSMDTITDLAEGGFISWEEHAALAPKTIDKIEKSDQLQPLFKNVATDIATGIRDGLKDKEVAPEVMGQVGSRSRVAAEIVKERFKAAVATNPSLLDPANRAQAEALLGSFISDVLQQPQFQVDHMKGWRAPMMGRPAPTTKNGGVDLTQVPYDTPGLGKMGPSRGSKGFLYDAQANPSKAHLIDSNTLQRDIQSIQANDYGRVSYRTKSIAEAMGLPPKAFLAMQAKAHGLPNPFPVAPVGPQAPTPKGSADYKPTTATNQSRRNVTVQIGRQLLNKGFVAWQHPNFDIDQGYVAEGGATVSPRNYESYHKEGRALDFPLSHNSRHKLDWLYSYLNQNRARFGIKELLWQVPGHMDHLHTAF